MKTLEKEKILRLNCPGFGEESFLTSGRAKSLDAYEAIIVNPVSILHLFDRDPDLVRQIEAAQSEGMTSINTNHDAMLEALGDEINSRTEQLVRFLEKGGLLVYFLCRPFLVQGNSTAMDNYLWLLSLAPDKSTERNSRHMSAVSHGRNVELTEEGEENEFADYLRQPGLEWNTIIRTDFLTEGYNVLATAGPKKCIAAHLYAGDQGGRIVFLPAPYSPDFDRTLMECVNRWYAHREGEEPEKEEVAALAAAKVEQAAAQRSPDVHKFVGSKPSSSGHKLPGIEPAATAQAQAPAATAQAQAPAAPPKQEAQTQSSSGLAAHFGQRHDAAAQDAGAKPTSTQDRPPVTAQEAAPQEPHRGGMQDLLKAAEAEKPAATQGAAQAEEHKTAFSSLLGDTFAQPRQTEPRRTVESKEMPPIVAPELQPTPASPPAAAPPEPPPPPEPPRVEAP
ncbi:MAG TPA: hypothetical protein V6D17_22670, partial [Candidatus Obscuribacterales bacterium]